MSKAAYLTRVVATPIITLAIGASVGFALVLACRFLGFNLTPLQERVAVIGFSLCFFIIGLLDTVARIWAYVPNRRKEDPPKQ
jgi:hypothetical protein